MSGRVRRASAKILDLIKQTANAALVANRHRTFVKDDPLGTTQMFSVADSSQVTQLTPNFLDATGPVISVSGTPLRIKQLAKVNPALAFGLIVTLPAIIADYRGLPVAVKNVTAFVSPIFVRPVGGDTIDGAASVTIAVGFGSVLVVADGVSNWNVV